MTGTMGRAVGSSLRSLGDAVPESDQGAAALARKYATLIDNAAPAAVYAKHLRALREALECGRIAGAVVVGFDVEKAYEAIEVALSAHSVASDLGPKLLATLTALGLTPAARAERGGGKTDDGRGSGSKTDELRKRRDDRAARAGGTG